MVSGLKSLILGLSFVQIGKNQYVERRVHMNLVLSTSVLDTGMPERLNYYIDIYVFRERRNTRKITTRVSLYVTVLNSYSLQKPDVACHMCGIHNWAMLVKSSKSSLVEDKCQTSEATT